MTTAHSDITLTGVDFYQFSAKCVLCARVLALFALTETFIVSFSASVPPVLCTHNQHHSTGSEALLSECVCSLIVQHIDVPTLSSTIDDEWVVVTICHKGCCGAIQGMYNCYF